MMNNDYRGDTLFRSYSVSTDNGLYVFQDGDVLETVFRTSTGENFLPRTIKPEQGVEEIDVVWTNDDMKNIPLGSTILETCVKTKDFVKTHQEVLYINEDFIVGEENA